MVVALLSAACIKNTASALLRLSTLSCIYKNKLVHEVHIHHDNTTNFTNHYYPTTQTNTTNMDFLKNVTGDKDAAQKPTNEQQQTTNQAAGGGFMDKLSGFTGGEQKPTTETQESSSGGFMDKLNSMAGGGKESEKSEDALDKGKSCFWARIGVAAISLSFRLHDTVFA